MASFRFAVVVAFLFAGQSLLVSADDQPDILQQIVGQNYSQGGQMVNAALMQDGCTVTKSSQFAYLCQIADALNLGCDAPIFPLGVLNYSANAVCDWDCRCIMGAQSGGCGKRPSDNKMFCHCDYEEDTSPIPTLKRLAPFCGPVFTPVTQICTGSTGATGELTLPAPINIVGNWVNQYACDVDCTCSHGYPNSTALNKCGTSPGATESGLLGGISNPAETRTNPYGCICGGGKNAW